jgi:hypothetical protein
MFGDPMIMVGAGIMLAIIAIAFLFRLYKRFEARAVANAEKKSSSKTA